MSLFNWGRFTTHAGLPTEFMIDCAALTDRDLDCAARMLLPRLPAFHNVLGIPRGGLRLAKCLRKFKRPAGKVLVVADDVYTTGTSFNEYVGALPDHGEVVGAVIFARNPTPFWIRALFLQDPERNGL